MAPKRSAFPSSDLAGAPHRSGTRTSRLPTWLAWETTPCSLTTLVTDAPSRGGCVRGPINTTCHDATIISGLLASGECQVNAPVAKRSDERFAAELLRQHFANSGRSAQIELNSRNDFLPDLWICHSGGQVWGVEVVRMYPTVDSVGGRNAVVSSEGLNRELKKLGEAIGEETLDIRKRDYWLTLRGPSSLTSPAAGSAHRSSQQRWAKMVKRSVRGHIQQDLTGALRGRGFTLCPKGIGKSWRVITSAGSHPIAPLLDGAVRAIFQKKAADLPRWQAPQRWLFVLNCFPLWDDQDATERIAQLLAEQEGLGFDGAFWSGYPDRRPIAVARPV